MDVTTRRAWDDTQSSFECCGIVEGRRDWAHVIEFNRIPASCCSLSESLCQAEVTECQGRLGGIENATCVESTTQIYIKGCGERLESALSDNYLLLASIGLLLALLQVGGLLSALLIGSRVANGRENEA